MHITCEDPVSIFLAFCGCIFLLSNKWWGYFQYVASILEILALAILVIIAFAMVPV